MTAVDSRLIDLLDFAQETGNELRLIESGKLAIIRNGRRCCQQRREELLIRQNKISRALHKLLNTPKGPLRRGQQ